MEGVMNKKIRFRCACGRVTAVDHRFAGCRGRCPRCQAVVRVPNAHPRAYDPRPRRREERRSQRLVRRSNALRRVGQVFTVLVLGVGVGLVVGGVTLF